MTEWAWIGEVVKAFGPAAAAFALVAGVIFFFYRRDHMTTQTALKDIVMKNTQSCDRLVEAVNKLSDTTHDSSAAFTRSLDIILRAFERRQP